MHGEALTAAAMVAAMVAAMEMEGGRMVAETVAGTVVLWVAVHSAVAE